MPVIFNRIFAYCKNRKVPLLKLEHRVALGGIIAEAYHQSGIKKHIHKVEKKEPEGTFKVLYYPKEFRLKIDRIIADYCEANSLDRPPKPEIKKRKRIPLKNSNG